MLVSVTIPSFISRFQLLSLKLLWASLPVLRSFASQVTRLTGEVTSVTGWTMAPSCHAKAIYLRYLLSFTVASTDWPKTGSPALTFHWNCVTAITTSKADSMAFAQIYTNSSPEKKSASPSDAWRYGCSHRAGTCSLTHGSINRRSIPIHVSPLFLLRKTYNRSTVMPAGLLPLWTLGPGVIHYNNSRQHEGAPAKESSKP